MAGIQAGGGSAGRLSIEIVAEVARLQSDMDKVRRLVKDASGEIARNAKAANDNLAAIGAGGAKGVQQFARDVSALKAQLDPAWAAMQKYRQEVEVAQRALAQGAISHAQYVEAVRQSATAAGLLKDKQAEAAAAAQIEAQAQREAAAATTQAALAAAEAARQQAAYAAQAGLLRAQLDPMFAAQQRFNQAMDQADDLLRAGAITTREYAAAQKLAREALGQHAKTVAGSTATIENLSPPLVKASSNARGFALQMSQVGQQVMAGTGVIQAFAMQLPDIAAGMNAGEAGGSKFATFLGGTWGIAVTAAIGLAATFGMKLLETDDAAKKTGKAQRGLVDVLRDSKASWQEVTKAAQDYADQQRKNRQLTIDEIRTEALSIKSKLEDARAIREKLAAQLEFYEATTRRGAQSEAGEVARQGAFARADQTREAIARNTEAMKKLGLAADETAIKYADFMAKINNDPAERIRSDFDVLEKRTRARVHGARELAAALSSIGASEQAALKEASEANRQHADETIRLAKVTGAEIAKALGAPVTSGLRSAARNKDIGGAKNSYHLTGQAIDIPISVNGRPFTKAGIRAALEPLGVQIKELLGPGDKGHSDHFHIAFGLKRLAPDQVRNLQEDAAEAARKAAAAAEDEMQKFRLHIFETSAEMSEAVAKAIAPGLLAAEQRSWEEFMAAVAKAGDAGVAEMAEAGRATAAWNDELVRTIDNLDRIGESGRALGDIGGALLGLVSGDFSGSRGPLGSLLQILGNTQWRDPADANGLGQIRILREEIVSGLDKVFGGKGTFAKTMNSLLQGAGLGMAAGSLVFGKQSGAQKAGSAAGGAVGGELGKMAAKPIADAIGGSMGKMFGNLAGPLGSMLGGVLGNVLGGMMTKVKWGRVDLSSSGVSATSGNSGSSEKAALQTGNSIFSGLKDLATQLGGVIGDFGKISVGVRHGDYRVNAGGTSLKVKKGAVDFNDDAEAAVAYAMKLAIERGAISGIRNSTNNLLKAGDDLQAQLQKAMNFEGVFTELKGVTDPVGAALDEVNRQFDQLRVVFKEAGATAEEYAQLEQLLTIRRNEALDKERDAIEDIRSRIAEAQGDDNTVKQIARTKELKDALNDNVRAELRRLYVVEDATAAQAKLTEAQSEAAAKAEQLRDAWASIGGDLMDEVNRIRGLTGGSDGASFATLQGQFNAAVGAARSGDQAAASKLADLSQSLIEAAQNAATSRQELDRVKAETAATLEGVARLAGAPAPQITGLPGGNGQSDNVSAELRDTREELAAMLQQLLVALAAIASNTGASTTILRNVTPSGNALAVEQAA